MYMYQGLGLQHDLLEGTVQSNAFPLPFTPTSLKCAVMF